MLDQPGEIAERLQISGARIDPAEHVEIDETVVDRGDNGIGHEYRSPRNRRIVPADIDDDEAVMDPRHAQLFRKLVLILLNQHDLLGPR